MKKLLAVTLAACSITACAPRNNAASEAASQDLGTDINYGRADAPTPIQGDTGSCYMWALQAMLSHRADPAERAAASRIDFAKTFLHDWWEYQDGDLEKALELEVMNYAATKKYSSSAEFKAKSEEDRRSALMWDVFEARPGLLGGLLLGQDSQASLAFEKMRKRIVLKSSDFVSDQAALKDLQDLTARFVEARWKMFESTSTLSAAEIKKAMRPVVGELAQEIATLKKDHGADKLPAELAKLKFNRVETKSLSVADKRAAVLSKMREFGPIVSDRHNHVTVITAYHAASDEFDVRDSESEELYYRIGAEKFFSILDAFEYMAK